jgi:hypothetical protein
MPADLNPVLDKLITKSEEGKVPWKPTYEGDTFIAALEGEFTFQIGKGGTQYAFMMKDREGNSIVDIFAQDRQQWSDRDFQASDVYFKKLEKLHDYARQIGFDIPRKLTDAESLLDRF